MSTHARPRLVIALAHALACSLPCLVAAQAPGAPSPAPSARPAASAPSTPAAPAAIAAPPASAPETRASATFAVVGDVRLTGADFQRALAVAMRKKYYHAKPPEAEYAAFQREVGDEMVNRVLLLAEARRRGILPDRDKIKATVAGYDAQYKGSTTWAANREKMLASVVPQLESDSLFERLEKLVKNVGEPAPELARAYYESHQNLFVEPEQVKLSLILLRVDPSSSSAVWANALAEARRIHTRIAGGANFAELAKLHSADRSAARGGELEYTHRGMLPEAVHGVVDQLQQGQVSEPVRLLEGYALLRLEGRKPAQQRSFEQVRDRAVELWQREEGQARWKKLIGELRREHPVRIDESHYAPLRAPAEKARAG